ncbi:TIGR01777 family oxidoreductase [uncultured Draconibacterium sp.]|uniref:TIGR01777 family oxidoreductase n=1 Tax=uncultured Draconibacterium sp. TaxID=1573823 RepID=UPI0025CD2EED|nr:TIGR01777 family oxidoreductase [uncultured Draconibacterium sp.]
MDIKLTGSNGYVGRLITSELAKKGHSASGIQRPLLYGPADALSEELRKTDVVINLAGASILQRWTEKNREIIYNSRVHTTQNLVKAIKALPATERPKKLISASAIGIYSANQMHTEESQNFDDGFLGQVVKDWENALSDLPTEVRQVIFRLGVVIGSNAKTIKNMLLPFRLGLGAKVASGKQAFPFIHEQDVVNAFTCATEQNSINGIYNLTAPATITNKEFTQSLAEVLKRPAFFTLPAFVLKAALGEAALLLLESPSVSSEKLLQAGFKFTYPSIDKALQAIISEG